LTGSAAFKSDPHEGIVTKLSREMGEFPRNTIRTLRKILSSMIRPKYGKEIADLANARRVVEPSMVKLPTDTLIAVMTNWPKQFVNLRFPFDHSWMRWPNKTTAA
jgi:hypothetical protein